MATAAAPVRKGSGPRGPTPGHPEKAAPRAPSPRAAAVPPMKRRALLADDLDGSSGQASTYFTNVAERTDLKFISTGCSLLNAAVGGGWVLGRCANIVGDKSAGKTLLAIEACANFHRTYPGGYIRYKEAEAAFDERYAEALGMPVAAVDFKGRPVSPRDEEELAELQAKMAEARNDREREPLEKAVKKLRKKGVGVPQNTIEAFYEDVLWCLDQNPGRPMLYVLDSLDALSDEAEQGREIGDASFGGSKPKKIGEMFRRLIDRLERQDAALIIVSQLRDKIGVTFGEKQTRSGGKALDYYASHIIWLSELGKIERTIDGIKRVTGVDIRARVRKNKVGLPFRECSYPILFGYGIDDLTAGVEWLIECKLAAALDELGVSVAGYKVRLLNLRNKGGAEVREFRKQMDAVVWREWQRIESGFLPKSRKY